jgi:hypothetical protein
MQTTTIVFLVFFIVEEQAPAMLLNFRFMPGITDQLEYIVTGIV